MTSRSLLAALTVCVAGASGFADAQVTVTFREGVSPDGYAGTRDVYLDDGRDHCWNPSVPCIAAEGRGTGGTWQEGTLLRWDVSGLPPGTPLQSAELVLSLSNRTTESFPVYECLRPWVSGQATWNQFASGQPWTVPGVQGVGSDRGGVPVASITGLTSFRTFTLDVALVQKWVDSPASNHGLVVQNYAAVDHVRWDAADTSVQERRPTLRIVHGSGQGKTLELQQGTAGYNGMVDSTFGIGPDPKTTNFNGWGIVLDGDPYNSTGLLKFDLSAVPAWATVLSTSLEVFVGNGTIFDYEAREALQPWTETGATWMSFDGTNLWSVPGATGTLDRGVLMATLPAGTQNAQPVVVPLTAAGVQRVQHWVRGVTPNHGFVIENHAAWDGLDLGDRENVTPSKRPGLSVTWVEGNLLVTGPTTGEPGQPLGPYVISRQQTDGPPIAAGAPALAVTVTSDSTRGEFSTAAAGPWSVSLQLTMDAGSASSGPFFFRDAVAAPVTIAADAGAAWDEIPLTVTLAFAPDAGPDTDAGRTSEDAGEITDAGGLDGGGGSGVEALPLTVGCGCNQGSLPLTAALIPALVLIPARTRRHGRPRSPSR